jgi:hypothetical protein
VLLLIAQALAHLGADPGAMLPARFGGVGQPLVHAENRSGNGTSGGGGPNGSRGNGTGGNGSQNSSAGSNVTTSGGNSSFVQYGMSAWNGSLTLQATATLSFGNRSALLDVSGTVQWPLSPSSLVVSYGDGYATNQTFVGTNGTVSTGNFSMSHTYIAQGSHTLTLRLADATSNATVWTGVSIVFSGGGNGSRTNGSGSGNGTAGSIVSVVAATPTYTLVDMRAWNGSLVLNSTVLLVPSSANASVSVYGTITDTLPGLQQSVSFGDGNYWSQSAPSGG